MQATWRQTLAWELRAAAQAPKARTLICVLASLQQRRGTGRLLPHQNPSQTAETLQLQKLTARKRQLCTGWRMKLSLHKISNCWQRQKPGSQNQTAGMRQPGLNVRPLQQAQLSDMRQQRVWMCTKWA